MSKADAVDDLILAIRAYLRDVDDFDARLELLDKIDSAELAHREGDDGSSSVGQAGLELFEVRLSNLEARVLELSGTETASDKKAAHEPSALLVDSPENEDVSGDPPMPDRPVYPHKDALGRALTALETVRNELDRYTRNGHLISVEKEFIRKIDDILEEAIREADDSYYGHLYENGEPNLECEDPLPGEPDLVGDGIQYESFRNTAYVPVAQDGRATDPPSREVAGSNPAGDASNA